MTRRTLLLVLLGGVLQAGAAPTTTLRTPEIIATFSGQGLASLEDRTLGKSVGFSKDAFSLRIDGATIRSEELKPARSVAKERVTYRYAAEGYGIDVVYEVKAGRRFVSKQLLVTKAPGPRFLVEVLEPLELVVDEEIDDFRVAKTSRPRMQTKDYAGFARMPGGTGFFALAQNPFLTIERRHATVRVSYTPDMEWRTEYGPYPADRALIGLYKLSGFSVPRAMAPEWKLPGASPAEPGLDGAEVDAVTEAVRASLVYQPVKPTRLFVGWCVNDYQIDTGTPQGRAEYRRIIDRAAELGIENVLYTPANSLLSKRADGTDDWRWEYVLWLGLGQKIRKGEWDPQTDAIPESVMEMLDYAKSKNVRLLAYVYPVLPFVQNREWLLDEKHANLGARGWQDWLIENMVAFAKRTGINGYSFDYTFLAYPGTSRYSQWFGWRRVMEELRRALPDSVIDGRQSYQEYGPWGWLAGSYPHPTGTDEQPESFVNFPDLHFDRVSADRQRYTAWWYRNFEFAPSEIVPGFLTHQTPRNGDNGEMPVKPGEDKRGGELAALRQRDWDYLGWRYSVISSIATGGWNSVVDMIPARDPEEFENFSEADKQWFRKWLDWADRSREYLRHTRTILKEPAVGRMDGTAAIVGNRGFVFVFNPNARQLEAEFKLDASIGLEAPGEYVLKELYPMEGRLRGRVYRHGDAVKLTLDGTSAAALELLPSDGRQARLFNAPGRVKVSGETVEIDGVRGEAGAKAELGVWLPTPGATVSALRVNGTVMKFRQEGRMLTIPVIFAGEAFAHSQQVGQSGEFRIPSRVFRQLAERRKAWPIAWTQEDLRTTWLAPERLLLYVQVAEPSDKMEAGLAIDGKAVELRKAYSSIAPSHAFTGWYADVSALAPDVTHAVSVKLPSLKTGQFQGIFFENVETEYTDRMVQ